MEAASQSDEAASASLPHDPPSDTEPAPTTPAPAAGQRPRLVIDSLLLENFKSYGGRVKIGPFHKRFSSIVGPNGSGKSNVIDAMLFVFGRRAKQLRHSKMSELLHHSQTHPNVTSGSVTVNFHEIIDTGDGDDDYEVVPGSKFSVARKAFKNNTSKYYLSRREEHVHEVYMKEVQMKHVIALLKGKGVDLDNNRFLILQGEVEQIAMMKPKAVNAHEDGLLEYLEDIIGSNRYVEEIDAAAARVETLNEERTHKLNRFKAVEKERDGLEDAKAEAEAILEKERQLHTKRSVLAAALIAEKVEQLKAHEEELDEAKAKHAESVQLMKEQEGSTKELEKKFNSTKRETDVVAKNLNAAKEEYASFERAEIQQREDLKALKAKLKKLQKSAEREAKKEEAAAENLAEHNENISSAQEACMGLEETLQKAEAGLEKVHSEIRSKTEPIRQKIEAKQKDRLPFTDAVNKCTCDLSVAKTELELLTDKRDAPARKLAAEEQALAALRDELGATNAVAQGLTADREGVRAALRDLAARAERLDRDLREKAARVAQLRVSAAEAQEASRDSSSRNRVQAGLAAAALDGRIAGVVGRLGDLASVAGRYDVAVAAAVGARLDFMVVRTADAATACVQLLKRERLGVATFVPLDKIQGLRAEMDAWKGSEQSRDGPRLFDLLNIPRPEHRVALYHALRNTLVAENIDDARRMAFKPSRKNRVVTVAGEVIEDSGAMSGGGRAPTRHRLGGKGGNAFEADPAALKRILEQLEEAEREQGLLQAELAAVKEERAAAELEGEKIELELRKAEMNVNSLKLRVKDIMDRRLPDLRKAVADAKKDSSGSGGRKIKDLEKKISVFEKQLQVANAACEGVEKEIEGLQDDIVAAGGKKLPNAKTKLEEAREQLSAEKSNLSKATSRAKEAEKTLQKSKSTQEKIASDIEGNLKEREDLKERWERMVDDAEKVMRAFNEAKKLHEEWSQTLVEVQMEFNELKESQKSLRREEFSLGEIMASAQRKFSECKSEVQNLRKHEKTAMRKLAEIHKDIAGSFGVKEEEKESMEVDSEAANPEKDSEEDDDGDDKNEAGEDVIETEVSPSEIMSAGEKKKMNQEIALLESEIGEKRPDLRAIADYQRKESECQKHAGELDSVTESRDQERKNCDKLRKRRLDEFMAGFSTITLKLKELYQMITLGGDAELELVDSLDPFSEGILFSVRPPKKSWKNISNLSGGEKTLSSLALVFALHHFKPTPLYFLDEIDAALDFKNVSIVANYVKERTKDAQFTIISLRNNMFELADRLVGIYKTHHSTKSVTINPRALVVPQFTKTAASNEQASLS